MVLVAKQRLLRRDSSRLFRTSPSHHCQSLHRACEQRRLEYRASARSCEFPPFARGVDIADDPACRYKSIDKYISLRIHVPHRIVDFSMNVQVRCRAKASVAGIKIEQCASFDKEVQPNHTTASDERIRRARK